MNKALARTLSVIGLSVGLAAPSLGTAYADPHAGDGSFPLTCGGTTYQVVTAGNGEWTPAHDTGSNWVFIPHAFTAFHGEVRDASGAVVDTFDEPGATQGKGKQKNDVSCSYSFHEVSDGSDPEFPAGYTFDGGGGVTGQIAGHA
ncbi:MAG TPA: hypothetical protein VM097_11595 [Mycobacteriales bacterium]|nr:hypothetical protein [Mycobacteriales bacterium]